MKNSNMRELKIAIIGCGAVFEQFYLPALKKMKLNITCCIDLDLSRASLFSKKLKTISSTDYKTVINEFDAAIILLPHFLHASFAVDLLNNGKHVLVEKPMALNTSECNTMITASKSNNKIIAVGNFRRNYKNTLWLKEQLNSDNYGNIKKFIIKEGGVYSWPVTTDSFWKIEKSGGGVLIDTGAHTLDQFTFWLGEAEVLSYKDDSYGGPEADCLMTLELENGAVGRIELSRSRNIGATAWIETDEYEIFIELTGTEATITPKPGVNGEGNTISFKKQSYMSLIQDQLFNWCDGIIKGGSKYVSGLEAKQSISIIEQCYKKKEKWLLPWVNYEN